MGAGYISQNPLFEASYERLFGASVLAEARSDGFWEAFYRRFLAEPGVRELFRHSDMTRQIAMLRKSLFHLVGFYVTSQPSGELERMSRVHHELGIDADHYDRWLDCLVATVSEFDPECDTATELAWRWALAPGITYMKLHPQLRLG